MRAFGLLVALLGLSIVQPGGLAAQFGGVSVSPDGGSATAEPNESGLTLTFTIVNDGFDDDTYDLSCSRTGSVSGCTVQSTVFVPWGGSAQVDVTYSTGAEGSGTVTLSAASQNFTFQDDGDYHVTVELTPVYAVAVTMQAPNPDSLPISTSYQVINYRVHNLGNTADTYTLTCSATGPGSCTWANLGTYAIASGADSVVQVSVNTGSSTGVATFTLTATGQSADSASHDVTVYVPDRVSVAYTAQHRLERSGCPTVGAGPNAMIQCGDLVYTHRIPGYRSMNRQRDLTLMYNSGMAFQRPVIVVDYTTFAGEQLPDQIRVRVIRESNGQVWNDVWYDASGFSGSQTQTHRLTTWTNQGSNNALWVNVEVTPYVGGNPQTPTVKRIRLLHANWASSPFGRGWWLAGVERLYPRTDAALLVRGDGSAVLFEKVGSDYVAPPGERSTLVKVGTRYRRTLADNRVSLWYRSNGLLDSIVDVHGNRATYTWQSSSGPYSWELLSITDPTGRAVTFGYVGGRVRTVSAPGAGTTIIHQSKDASGSLFNVDSITDPDGFVTRFQYFTWHRMRSSDARGTGTVEYRYDLVGRIDSTTAPGGISAPGVQYRSWQMMGLGHPTLTSSASPATPVLRDDAYVLVSQWRGGGAQDVDTARFRLDRFQLPVDVDLPETASTLIYRDSIGQPIHIFQDGMEVWQEWDAQGNLKRSITRGVDGTSRDTTRYEYHATWQSVTKIVPPERDSVRFGYDANGNRIWAIDAGGYQTTFGYNARGQIDTIWEPGENVPTTYTYDASTFNLTSVSDSAGSATYVYDPVFGSDVVKVLDAHSNETRYTYDAIKRVRSVVRSGQGDGDSVEYQYDDVNRIRTQIDPRGYVSTWEYDVAGRLKQRCARPGWCETTTYGDGRNPTQIQQRDGSFIVQEFDGANRVVERKVGFYGQDDIIYFGYNGRGQLESVFNRYARIHRNYDAYGRLTFERQAMRTWNDSTFWRGSEVRHAYDRNGRRKFTWVGEPVDWELGCVPMPDQVPCDQDGVYRPIYDDSISYGYDQRGNLDQLAITHWKINPGSGNHVWGFEYDGKGRLEETSFPLRNGSAVRVFRAYDNDDRVRRHWSTGGSIGLDDNITWNAVGQAEYVTLWGGNRTATYGYDGLGRLKTISGSHESDTYTYDDAGNRLTSNSGSWTYNSKGQLTSSNVGYCATTYDYDTRGNQTYVDPSNGCSSVNWRDMDYDIGGRMISMRTNKDVDGTQEREFWYDGLGRRILMRSNHTNAADWGVWRYFWFDDNVGVKTHNAPDSAYVDLFWPEHSRNASGALEGRGEWFFYAPGVDNLLASWNYLESETRHLFFRDWRGSVVKVSNEWGTSLGLSPDQYEAFGSAINAPSGDDDEKNPGYNSHESADGLVYMRNRWYDPNTGRFTQEDPIGYGGGSNLY